MQLEVGVDVWLSADGDLFALIRAKQSSREQQMDSFMDKLEHKYSSGNGSRGKTRRGSAAGSNGAGSSATASKSRKGKGRRKK